MTSKRNHYPPLTHLTLPNGSAAECGSTADRPAAAGGLSWAARVRLALCDLKSRWRMVSLNVVTAAVAGVYLLFCGFYAAGIHEHQRGIVNAGLPTKVLAAVLDPHRTEGRFTDARLRELGDLPHVKIAFPAVELNCWLSIDGAEFDSLQAEGTVDGDPTLAADRLAWGRAVSADSREIVMGLPLFQRLRGRFEAGRPVPDRVTVEFRRTQGGQVQVHREKLDVVGLLRSQNNLDRVYMPLAMVQSADLWSTGRVDEVGLDVAAITKIKRIYTGATVYVPDDQADFVADEAKRLKVHLEPRGSVRIVEAGGPIWATIEAPAAQAEVIAGPSARQVRVLRTDHAVIAALAPNDPRWGGMSPAAHVLYRVSGDRSLSAAALKLPVGVEIVPAPRDLYAGADFVCGQATLAWIAFDPRVVQRGITPLTVAHTNDARAAAALAERIGYERVSTDRAIGHLTIDITDNAAAVDEFGAGLYRYPGLAHGSCAITSVRLGLDITSDPAVLRAAPKELIRQIAPSVDQRPSGVPALVHVYRGARPARELWINDRITKVAVALGAGDGQESIWVDIDDLATIGVDAPVSALCVWGPWDELCRLRAETMPKGWSISAAGSSFPGSFVAVVPNPPAGAASPKFPREVTLSRLTGVPARVAGRSVLVVAANDYAPACGSRLRALPGPREALRCDEPPPGVEAAIVTPAMRSQLLTFRRDAAVAPGLVVVNDMLFRQIAFANCDAPIATIGTQRTDICTDPIDLARVQSRAAAVSGRLRHLAAIPHERTLLAYLARDLGHADGKIGEDLIAVMELTKPTFASVRPDLQVDAAVVGGSASHRLTLHATDAADPARFNEGLLAGAWAVADGNQVVLPAKTAQVIAAGRPAATVIGSVIIVAFEREGIAGQDTVEIPMRVVGVIHGDNTYAGRDVLDKIYLWRARSLEFDAAHSVFRSPAQQTLQAGHLRATFFADNLDHVEEIVAALNAFGYRTQDALDTQKGLAQLARSMVALLAFLMVGLMVNGGISTWISGMMNVDRKKYEIGILRACGASRADVLAIFVVQGLFIGGLAFCIAATLTLFESALRPYVCAVLSLRPETFNGTPLGHPALLAIALAVCVGMTLVAVLMPAVKVCRRTPVELLRNRDS